MPQRSQYSERGETMNQQQAIAQAEAIFRRMLKSGKPVAFEDAARLVETDDDFDRRAFGHIPAKMHRDGEIVPAGYRESVTSTHHAGIKRLWVLAPSIEKGAAA
ncbi:hypothetical protein [Rhodopirellula baltica]